MKIWEFYVAIIYRFEKSVLSKKFSCDTYVHTFIKDTHVSMIAKWVNEMKAYNKHINIKF